MAKQAIEPEEELPDHESPLPPWLIILITIVLTCLFVLNIWADIFKKGYNGYPTTALLGLMIGAILGIGRYFRIFR